MKPAKMLEILILAAVITLAINIYVAYSIKVSIERTATTLSPISPLSDWATQLRAIISLVMILFVEEYLAYEVKTGYIVTLLRLGIGLKRYILEKMILFTSIAIVLALPTYFLIFPNPRYSEIAFYTILGDVFTVIMFGFITSIALPNIAAVVLGSMVLTYLIKGPLTAAIYTMIKNEFAYYLMNPMFLLFESPAVKVNRLVLVAVTIAYIAVVLLVTYLASLKIALRRGGYRWAM